MRLWESQELAEMVRRGGVVQGGGASGHYPGRALFVLLAACRTPWMLTLVAQTTRPAPWPAVSPWKPRQFWSGQGFS